MRYLKARALTIFGHGCEWGRHFRSVCSRRNLTDRRLRVPTVNVWAASICA